MARSMPARVRAAALALILFVAAGAVVVQTPASAAAGPCGPEGNEIACENAQPGADPDDWDIEGAGDDDIQGYATDISVDVGGSIGFKVDTDALDYTITIYRTGWYGGDGAREVAAVEPSAELPQHQPECRRDQDTDLYDCGEWGVSATWDVPATAVSGVYIAVLERDDTGGRSHITFVVRDDDSDSDILFQTSDTTWQAYNTYGGSDFYQGAMAGRAYKVSYNRPFATRGVANGRDFYFSAEYAMVRFLERNGYDVSYTTGVDSDRRGDLIRNHRVLTSTGHDEYWSGQQRANVEAARDAGVHLAFFSGNEMYWRVRWEDAAAGDPASYRTLTSYKETWGNAKIDPATQWTGTWRDPRFAAPADGGGLPENAVTGTAYMSNHSDLPVTVSAEEGRLRLWRDTPLADLPGGGSAELAPHTIGYESNEDLDNGSRPEGLIRLSTTVGEVPEYLQDFGNVVAPGSTTHHVTMYRAPSGALVFSAGSVQWAWGLDQEHDGDGAPADPRMQQATANLFADMEALPATLQDDLVAPTASTDETAPTAAIATPVAGERMANGATVTATGTAADAGGGRVAGVEVSTDDGATWHPADGTDDWSYTYTLSGDGPVSVLARAVDDSANIGSPARVGFAADCPCTVFGAQVPDQPAVDDDGAVELGLRFTPQIDGFATGVRFYRGEGNTGRHVGTLWTAGHQRLSTVEFADDPALGWQTARFASAVPLTAGETYIVSYAAPSGHYASQADVFWARGLQAPPLTVAGGFGAEPAGVYAAPGEFPSASWGSSHYFVDVLFSAVDDSPLAISSRQPLAGSGSVARGAQVAATLSKPVDPASAQLTLTAAGGVPVPGAVAYDAVARRVAFTPDEPLAPAATYTAAVAARDPQGREIEGPATWSFTTAPDDRPEGACPCSLFAESTEPMVLEVPEDVPLTLGVRFAASSPGTITAIRFYKGPGNTGQHRGALWTAGGSRIGDATFADESTQGWQTAQLDQPVHVDAGSEYIASYTTTVGRYAYSIGSFDAGLVRGPLSAPVNGGAYSYQGGFPGERSPGDYLVDVVFMPDDAVPALLEATPGDGDPGATAATVSARFDLPLPPEARLTLASEAGPVAGTTTLSGDGRTLSFAPAARLDPRTAYTAEASGIGGPAVSWRFETAGADGCPCTVFGGEAPPEASAADASRVELGMEFTPSEDGVVTGIRFYRGPANPGPHAGTLWSAGGAPVATATFPDDAGIGWQTAPLDEPYPVQAGTSYVVSYLAPSGGYAAEAERFAGGAIASGPLTAAAANGRYAYGGGFPRDSWRSTSYFVDVVFERG